MSASESDGETAVETESETETGSSEEDSGSGDTNDSEEEGEDGALAREREEKLGDIAKLSELSQMMDDTFVRLMHRHPRGQLQLRPADEVAMPMPSPSAVERPETEPISKPIALPADEAAPDDFAKSSEGLLDMTMRQTSYKPDGEEAKAAARKGEQLQEAIMILLDDE